MPESPLLSCANAFDVPNIVVTPQVRRVIDICAAVQHSHTLGFLVGLAGVGKTWAVQYAAQQHGQPEEPLASPVLYTCIDVENTPRTFVRNLLTCLGPDYRAPVPDLTTLVCCWIHRRMTSLIILDEADRLDKTSWEIIRDIHDRTRCAFLCVAQPGLLRTLQRHEQLLNRIGLTVELDALSFDDLWSFLRTWQELRPRPADAAQFYILEDAESETMVKEIYRVTLGNLRRVCQLIQEAERVAHVNRQWYVPLAVVQATAQLLARSWYG